jgi:hypothetical protein
MIAIMDDGTIQNFTIRLHNDSTGDFVIIHKVKKGTREVRIKSKYFSLADIGNGINAGIIKFMEPNEQFVLGTHSTLGFLDNSCTSTSTLFKDVKYTEDDEDDEDDEHDEDENRPIKRLKVMSFGGTKNKKQKNKKQKTKNKKQKTKKQKTKKQKV